MLTISQLIILLALKEKNKKLADLFQLNREIDVLQSISNLLKRKLIERFDGLIYCLTEKGKQAIDELGHIQVTGRIASSMDSILNGTPLLFKINQIKVIDQEFTELKIIRALLPEANADGLIGINPYEINIGGTVSMKDPLHPFAIFIDDSALEQFEEAV